MAEKIVIVDDDEAVRTSTARLLQRSGHEICAYASGDEFLDADLPEDIGCVLLDIRMPGSDGLTVMRSLRERGSRLRIIVLTGHGDIALAIDAMKLGAVDFLEKPYDPEHLLGAIESAFAQPGRAIQARVVATDARGRVAELSERQRDVLRGILKGKQNKAIAFELNLSPRTVETYRAQMLAKLGVRGTADAVRVGLAAGLDAD